MLDYILRLRGRIGLEGGLGSGKSGGCAWIGYFAKTVLGMEVYTNMPLTFADYFIDSLSGVMRIKGTQKGAIFVGDELWLWAESDEGSDGVVKLMKHIAALSRKRNFATVFNQQYDKQLQRGMRQITDYWLYPRVDPSSFVGYLDDGKPKFARVLLHEDNEFVTPAVYWFNMLKVGKMFDTNYEIQRLTRDDSMVIDVIDQVMDDSMYQLYSKPGDKEYRLIFKYKLKRDMARYVRTNIELIEEGMAKIDYNQMEIVPVVTG